ncbi:cupin-like domain-containing protein [Myxococcus sp. K38C18041901]|uniref:cupin-like domain-containing protein n=1 Tax=Myxococcus guangdongensis TaxID=2906760 RepID=UPI0020A6F81B|nr:cupin-like domain-containing protein [Myxococcus guangdongensis]MCP3059801.1 cupin-like domain-containing protein [Myxococcus guangdongensis]
MNPAGPSTAEQLSRHLAREMAWGLTGYPGNDEVCQVTIGDVDTGHRVQLHLRPQGIDIQEDGSRPPDAKVWVPNEVAHLFVSEARSIDLRDSRIHAGLRYEGDPLLVTRLGQALLRPSPEVRAVYEAAEQRAGRGASLETLERVHRPSVTVIKAALEASRPLVATGLLDACLPRDWEELAQRVVGITVEPRSLGRAIPLSEFIQSVRSRQGDGATYSEGCMLPPTFTSLFPLAFGPEASRPVRLPLGAPQLWAGTSDSTQPVTGLHRDPVNGLLIQLQGRKRVLLYSPLERDNLYPVTAYNSFQNCWVDPLKPRLDVHPRFKRARRLEVELAPGEVLLNPVGWFHCVVIDGPTFSVSVPVKGR